MENSKNCFSFAYMPFIYVKDKFEYATEKGEKIYKEVLEIQNKYRDLAKAAAANVKPQSLPQRSIPSPYHRKRSSHSPSKYRTC